VQSAYEKLLAQCGEAAEKQQQVPTSSNSSGGQRAPRHNASTAAPAGQAAAGRSRATMVSPERNEDMTEKAYRMAGRDRAAGNARKAQPSGVASSSSRVASLTSDQLRDILKRFGVIF